MTGVFPDGHRCEYARRESLGPRGGKRWHDSAKCVGCGAGAEVDCPKSGADCRRMARTKLVMSSPQCPKPLLLDDSARALDRLARDFEASPPLPAVPTLEWVTEFGQGAESPDAAVQRAWAECNDGEAMMRFARARFPEKQRLSSHSDELHREACVELTVDGVVVSLRGAPAAVADALRRHVLEINWERKVQR